MNNLSLIITGIVTGLLAFACCLGPALAGILGLGFISNLSQLEPYRPYLLGLTAILFIMVLYKIFRLKPCCKKHD